MRQPTVIASYGTYVTKLDVAHANKAVAWDDEVLRRFGSRRVIMDQSKTAIDPLERSKLRLLSIRELLQSSVAAPKYKTPNHLHEPIKLTEAGDGFARRLMKSNQVSWADARLACFLQYSYNGPLVDAEGSDFDAMLAGLGKEIIEGQIKHPYIFGRLLFDKAQAENIRQRDSLSPDATWQFLSDTPCGVFQSNEVLVGPLGALVSREHRELPPIVGGRLYMCENLSCHTAHWTFFSTAEKLPILTARDKLTKMLEATSGPGIRDESIGILAQRLAGYYDDTRSSSIAPLLAEGFSRNEICELIRHACTGRDSELRAVLKDNLIDVKGVDEFLLGKNVPELLQVLLLLPDNSLTAFIDEMVRSGGIVVPEHEVRQSKVIRVSTGFFGLHSEVSPLGLRHVSTQDMALPNLRLRNLVRELHNLEDLQARQRLEWILRRTPGESLEEKLDYFMHSKPPHEIVTDLIVAHQENFLTTAYKYGLGSADNLVTLDDEQLAHIVLWKLGFELPAPGSDAAALRRYKDSFQQAAVASSYRGKQDREEIRSRSANLFVALEKSLSATLCFACWSLIFDHWSNQPRFIYSPDEARRFAATIINSRMGADQVEYNFDPSGKNTLAVLFSGMGHVRKYLEELSQHCSGHERSVDSSPDYAHETRIEVFPFKHVIPFLDLSSASRKRIVDHLGSLIRSLDRGNVIDVRNRLEHHRDDFPTQDELTTCAAAIGEFLDVAEQSGLHPTWFVFDGVATDAAGRGEQSFVDYLGRRYTERVPSPTAWPERDNLAPRIIVPSAIINDSDIALQFSHGAESEYTQLWNDWPPVREKASDADRAARFISRTNVYSS